jgi:hypothetical protein
MTGFRIVALVFVTFVSMPFPASAYEEIVHREITKRAATAAEQRSLGYAEFFNVIASPTGTALLLYNGTLMTPAEWMVEGSDREDNTYAPGDEGGIRSYAHFYDPFSGEGLSNLPPDQKRGIPGFRPSFGIDSFSWGSRLNVDGFTFHALDVPSGGWNTFPKNRWSWQNAREYQLAGLTQPSAALRRASLAQLYRSLGQVVHLVQDLAQPQHVRDEQHLDKVFLYESPIEKYSEQNVHTLNYVIGILDWRAAGFTKLRDFWDRDLYTWNRNNPAVRSHQALSDHEDVLQPQKTLGLAEYVNGNFLADRHTYREHLALSAPFHYPYPSLMEGTDFALLVSQPGMHGKPTNIPNGPGTRFNVTKGSQGRAVFHHASISFLTAMNRLNPEPKMVRATIDDPDVLKSYHDILIPEAIRYSAGVLDYFFRGRLAVGTTASSTPGRVAVRVINRSGQALLDGAFSLYYDDAAGTRTQINPSTTTYSSPLPDNGSFTLEFIPPSTPPVSYMLVYKGSVGSVGYTSLDPVDSGIAIAAARFTRDAFIDDLAIDGGIDDLADDGSVVGNTAAGRPAYYSGVTRTTRDTRTSTDSAPITVTQTGNTVTANDILFSATQVGRLINFASGQTATITAYISPTQVTVTPSQTVPATTILIQGGTLGGPTGFAHLVNANGIVAGEEDVALNVRHVFWLNTLTGEIRDLGENYTWAIDNAGWLLLGGSRLYNPVANSFIQIGQQYPNESTHAVAMNPSHVVAVYSYDPVPGKFRAARWLNGVFTSIHPAAAGNENSFAVAINASGTIAGEFDDPVTLGQRVFVNSAGNTMVFGLPSANSYVMALNDQNVVVGETWYGGTYVPVPYRWTEAGGMQNIPLLPGTSSGTAWDVNNAGDVVGEMEGIGGPIAFLYRAGTTYRLMELVAGIEGASGWTELYDALFINDNNDIVGSGVRNGVWSTYRLHLPP